jgi:hypothetical protein
METLYSENFDHKVNLVNIFFFYDIIRFLLQMRIVLKVLNRGTGIAIRIVSSIGHIVSALH